MKPGGGLAEGVGGVESYVASVMEQFRQKMNLKNKTTKKHTTKPIHGNQSAGCVIIVFSNGHNS